MYFPTDLMKEPLVIVFYIKSYCKCPKHKYLTEDIQYCPSVTNFDVLSTFHTEYSCFPFELSVCNTTHASYKYSRANTCIFMCVCMRVIFAMIGESNVKLCLV
jgi:hypothetical protein